MDDEQVKAVLAEFMGYVQVGSLWREDACGRPDSYIRTDHLPRYLTDYNDIAEVWRRVRQTSHGTYWKAATVHLGGAPDTSWHTSFSDYFTKEPRDHAHALAKAILEAKKNDEPGDCKGENY